MDEMTMTSTAATLAMTEGFSTLHALLWGAVLLGFAFVGAPLWLWTAGIAVGLWGFGVSQTAWIAFGLVAVVLNVPPIRTLLLTSVVFKLMKAFNFIPQISPTEAVALKAGDVWIERELFSGKPNFKRMLEQNYPKLTSEEQAFLDNQVERLCEMVDDWKIWKTREIPKDVFDYICREKFLGMIVPKEYGGLGFSATAHSAVIQKLTTRSVPVTVTVMVPNSLGPAELLNHYGTEEQKRKLLPRLATGQEIPCFALTEPTAGSDAASIQASGVVMKGADGKLSIKLNWNKRWITLSSQSTTLGLAFRLYDPENHLGKGEDVGITCALIPTKTAGVTADRRHDPLFVPFVNSPTQGKDVIVPIESIIGEVGGAGRGWEMLMECLGAGRGISLPAQAAGGLKFLARVVGAHAKVRKQFGMSIGNFEGIQEPLARIAGYNYMIEAARLYTTGALDSGSKPPVVTAVMKYYTTEIARKAINDGMDIVGGAAIVLGPRNLLAHSYVATPISITVEGANILTRTLMIFGQGALRAHPYAFKEVDAIERGDLSAFDRAFWAHIGHVIRNTVRAVLLSLTRGYLVLPARGGVTAKYYRRIAWASATFAFLTDLFMGSLGGKLKARGKITGRMADILGYLYLAMATLRRFEAEGRPAEDAPYVRWALDSAFKNIQEAFDGLFASIELPVIGAFFRGPIRWYSALNPIGHAPSDAQDIQLALLAQKPGAQRDRHTDGIFVPKDLKEHLAQLEYAFKLAVQSEETDRKVKRAVREKKLKKKPARELYKDALAASIITQDEFENVARAEEVRNHVIQVDSFSQSEYVGDAEYKAEGMPLSAVKMVKSS